MVDGSVYDLAEIFRQNGWWYIVFTAWAKLGQNGWWYVVFTTWPSSDKMVGGNVPDLGPTFSTTWLVVRSAYELGELLQQNGWWYVMFPTLPSVDNIGWSFTIIETMVGGGDYELVYSFDNIYYMYIYGWWYCLWLGPSFDKNGWRHVVFTTRPSLERWLVVTVSNLGPSFFHEIVGGSIFMTWAHLFGHPWLVVRVVSTTWGPAFWTKWMIVYTVINSRIV